MSLDLFAVQDGLVTHLAGDATLTTYIGTPPRLFDYIPDQSNFPFITLGAMDSENNDAIDTRGMTHRVALHVWSKTRSSAEAKSILTALYNRLHHASFSVSGQTLTACTLQDIAVMLDDEETYHGIAHVHMETRG